MLMSYFTKIIKLYKKRKLTKICTLLNKKYTLSATKCNENYFSNAIIIVIFK